MDNRRQSQLSLHALWKQILQSKNAKHFLIVVFTPILLLPLPCVVHTEAARCGYVVLLVAVFWILEALPLAITALIPAVLFPLMGIIPSKELAPIYMKDIIMMFMGSFAVAIAIEKWNLHKRIALKVLLVIGCSIPRLLFGFMSTGMFLSMWMSNTAVTTMMIVIVEAVLQQLKRHLVVEDEQDKMQEVIYNLDGREVQEMNEVLLEVDSKKEENVSPSNECGTSDVTMSLEQYNHMCTMMRLAVAYSCTIGGTATLIGTAPTMVLKSQSDIVFQAHGLDSPITFGSWMLNCVPLSVVMTLVGWVYLQCYWMGTHNTTTNLCGKSTISHDTILNIRLMLKHEYDSLGPMKFAEKVILINSVTVALLWLTRDLRGAGGWASIFKEKFVGSSVPSIFIVLMLFILPSQSPWRINEAKLDDIFKPILDIKTWVDRTPWHIMLLLGGGLVMAEGCSRSGLSLWVGLQLSVLQDIPAWVMILVISTILSFLTEVTSNVVVTSISQPILAQLAASSGVSPLYLMVPGAISCTFAFMLPVATPPNAIIFSYGHLTIPQMAKCGIWLNLICVLINALHTNTLGVLVYQYHQLPDGWSTYHLNATSPPDVTSLTGI